MSKLAKRIFFSLLCLAVFLLWRTPSYAADFATYYNTTYAVSEDGEVRVTQNVTIENLTSQFFVSKYAFTIGSEAPENISAWDQGGAITPQVVKENSETSITIKFNVRVVGKGNKLNFGIAYDFPDLAAKNGLLWELNLLKITGLENIRSYRLTVTAPQSFGPLLLSSPPPSSQTVKSGQHTIVYEKGDLAKGAPRLAFGNFQLYQLTLTYHLKNPSIGLGYTEIAIPPDIPGYQQIIQTSLLPKADSIRVDGDGNYLARYNLGPVESQDVVWEGFVALFYPERNFGSGKAEALPPELVLKYSGPDKYWETQEVEIQAQSAKLFDLQVSVAESARKIYEFVTGELSYNYQKLETGELIRLGALAALSQKDQAVCMEYTDLFIALARAGGIPAREVNGYAYTADDSNRPLSLKIREGDVLHAWPQVYIPESGWVMIDPTWGSTSGGNYFSAFDLSHLTFVIKGEDSQYPLPAGSYKTEPEQKDVRVSFSENTSVVEESPQLEVQVEFSRFAISPFDVKAVVKVKNTGKTTAFETGISLESTLMKLKTDSFNMGSIPPEAEVEREIILTPENAFVRGVEELTVLLSAEDFSGEVIGEEVRESKILRPIYLPLSLAESAVLAGAFLMVFYGRKILLARISG